MMNTGGISTKHLRQNVNGVSVDFCRLQHKLWGSLKILGDLRALERKPIIQNEIFLSLIILLLPFPLGGIVLERAHHVHVHSFT